MSKRTKNQPPSLKQRKAAQLYIKNGGNLRKAMLEAGYSKTTAKNSHLLKRQKSWQTLMDEYFPDDFVAEEQRKLLSSHRLDHYEFPAQEKDAKIMELFGMVEGVRLLKIEKYVGYKRAYFICSDNVAKAKALDMIYKLKDKYAAKRVKIEDPYEKLSDEELDARIRENEGKKR
jgi:hypothetical protein